MDKEELQEELGESVASTPNRSSIWQWRTLCLITGASRGLGQRMAIRFAERFPQNSALMLLARNYEELQETKTTIGKTRPDIKVSLWAVDLVDLTEATASEYLQRFETEFGIAPGEFEQLVLVHNAGSLGNVSNWFTDHSDAEELNTYWSLNLTSVAVLNSAFWKNVGPKRASQQRVVINISSLCALKPFSSWSIYCAGKAARDIMFATMALEEPDIVVLNYSPGPLDTNMQEAARTQTKDHGNRKIFAELQAKNQLLSCDQTLDRLIGILDRNHFNSGSHVEYYDDHD